MLAYKFLASGAVAPFTGRQWPIPGPAGPGAWIEAPAEDLARYGVHACRAEDLAHWPDDELWLVELEDPVVPQPFHVAAARGRLLERIDAWNEETSREYAAACAWRARDIAADALERGGLTAEATALRACADLASLEAVAKRIAGDAAREEPRGNLAYVAGAAMRARQGWFREASLQCAHLGASLAGTDTGAERERAWLGRWLAHRLRLDEVTARYVHALASV